MRWFLIKTARGADRAMNVTNLIFASSFISTRVVIYFVGLTHLLQNLFFIIWPAANGEEQALDALPQCKTQLPEEGQLEVEQVQTETTKEEDVASIGCERAQQMICGVVGLLVAGQFLNLIWANQIIRMARKTKDNAGVETGQHRVDDATAEVGGVMDPAGLKAKEA